MSILVYQCFSVQVVKKQLRGEFEGFVIKSANRLLSTKGRIRDNGLSLKETWGGHEEELPEGKGSSHWNRSLWEVIASIPMSSLMTQS